MTAVATAPEMELHGGLNADEWADKYQQFQENPPQTGDVLRCISEEEEVRLDVELHSGKAPFVYGRVYVPCIVGEPIGWYMHSTQSENAFGLKCILMPKAREELLRKKGIKNPIVGVKEIRVIKWSQSGNSILCEVSEY